MPTLDDAPTIEKLLGSTELDSSDSDAANEIALGDLIQVFDVSEQKAKIVSVRELMKSIALTPFGG
jgi:hypothetical protein